MSDEEDDGDEMRKRLSGFVLLVFITVSVFADWEIFDTGISVDLHKVCFVDSQHGWAISDSGLIICTRDGGQSWEIQDCGVSDPIFNEIQFVDSLYGFIVGRDGLFLSTSNGGNTWMQKTLGTDFSLEDLCFVNKDTGWVAAGDFFNERLSGVIYHSDDGGDNWEVQLQIVSENTSSSKLFSAIVFIDSLHGWAFAGEYISNWSPTNVYQTKNGGKVWEESGVAQSALWEISAVSMDTIWGVGYGFGRSYNGGIDWFYNTPSGGNSLDIAQIDGKTGWVSTVHLQNRRIVFTMDGGLTWEDFLVFDGHGAYALSNIGDKYLWAVGIGGKVMRYEKQTSDLLSDQIYQLDDFQLSHNCPNPFNSETIIGYKIPIDTDVVLSIIDINGREIAKLVNEHQSRGNYHVSWNATLNGKKLPSGVYFYRVQAVNHSQIKKMLLLK